MTYLRAHRCYVVDQGSHIMAPGPAWLPGILTTDDPWLMVIPIKSLPAPDILGTGQMLFNRSFSFPSVNQSSLKSLWIAKVHVPDVKQSTPRWPFSLPPETKEQNIQPAILAWWGSHLPSDHVNLCAGHFRKHTSSGKQETMPKWHLKLGFWSIVRSIKKHGF